ncbi:MAG: hypothetical protein IJ779_05630 [Ruminococcus sp.]|nr:hypothetical protein [Ruminococcus sp.]
MSNKKKDLDSMYRELMNSREHNEDAGTRLAKFFIGLVMLAVGLFMIFQNITVSSSWGRGGYFYHIGNFGISNGMIMLPIIIGIGMLFFMRKRIFGWIVLAIGVAFVLFTVLATTHITWRTTSAYVFVIMFGMTAAGAGLVLRELFRKD